MRDMVLKNQVLLFKEKVRMTGGRHRVVVIGGGFGGINVTRALAGADVDVTVLNRTNHHLFQPLLYQVAAGILPEGLIAPALRNVIRKQANARTLLADVQDLDVPGRVVSAVAPDGRQLALPYDTLVVASGAADSYFGNEEWAEFAPGLKDPRRRTPPAQPHPQCLRDGRAGHLPGRTGRISDLRGDRSRPDRG
jgi:NADPH-dependent 2,4-dienoyl-CoA reductase/sulfur reductase-like enzyme